jgi:hypothetical protein
MKRKCPSCGSTNVRRSSIPPGEITWRNEVLSPYRCRDCMLQFWVISRKTYLAAAWFVAAIAVVVLAVFLIGLLAEPESSSLKRQRRSDGGQQERVVVAADIRFVDVTRIPV